MQTLNHTLRTEVFRATGAVRAMPLRLGLSLSLTTVILLTDPPLLCASNCVLGRMIAPPVLASTQIWMLIAGRPFFCRAHEQGGASGAASRRSLRWARPEHARGGQ